ncbi:Rdx family-domain-containing protein [Suillus paluster]|uniref:Rdx family-domain-containing protein n=1 Tax=Suillus paluster TaxID=48578 RepID=UPI001B877D8A|nr:Rdx family-domain-containing protein [Suillus paluster]KAG1753831.1 Rdx family-domain-containing protein [Suillus paluster]
MAEMAGASCPLPIEQDNAVSSEQPKGNLALDSSTFVPPIPLVSPSIIIEFCDRCRWLHRATWVSTELFLTFPPPALKAITIIPLNSEETGGRFRVWLNLEGSLPHLMWDRKIEGGFPELKNLKQRIRDHVQPGKSLGHSDKKSE